MTYPDPLGLPASRATRATHRLAEHVDRTGAQAAVLADATARLQYELLRQFVTIAEAALANVGIPDQEAGRALDLIIYACVPDPVEVAQRKQLEQALMEAHGGGGR